VTNHLTAREFQTMTGLTAEALRVYTDYGIIAPENDLSGTAKRTYARSQLQRGIVIDLLRRSHVPLDDLVFEIEFPFDQWRARTTVYRQLDDFYLDVAEQVAAFTAGQFTTNSSPAPAANWVGVDFALDLPEDTAGQGQAVSGWAVDMPGMARALTESLNYFEVAALPLSWSMEADGLIQDGIQRVLLCRAVPDLPGEQTLALMAQRMFARTGGHVSVVSGTLPARREITFAVDEGRDLTPVDEAAAGYLQLLAFEEHLAQQRLEPIRHTARQVVQAGTLFGDPGRPENRPVSIFDAWPPEID